MRPRDTQTHEEVKIARLEDQLETLRKVLERIANDATPLGFKIIAREALEQIDTLTRERNKR